MADSKKVDKLLKGESLDNVDPNIALITSEVCSTAGSVKTSKTQRMSSSSERQEKFERAHKALENAALVSKRIKEHRKATAELLGKPFEEDDIGESAEMASTVSERTGYSVATDTSTTLSVQDALNIPGISESLANTLKQKELLMERIKQYKEISKRPMKTMPIKKVATTDSKVDIKKKADISDNSQLLNTIKDKENAFNIMQVRIKAMETTILDLEEKINEKDQIIDAKNMATTLMSDSLSKKEKDSLLLLEDTRQQMTKMQENFISMEIEWKEERERLLKEMKVKDEKIHNLEEANTILEKSRFDITVAHSKLLEEVKLKNKEILDLQENIEKLSREHVQEETPKEKEDYEEEKGSLEISQMVELTKKVELLEQINCQIRQTNIELENKLASINTESKSSALSSPCKKGSPLPARKGGRNTASKIKSPWTNLTSEPLQQDTDKKPNKSELSKLEMLVQSLNKDILDKEYIISQKDCLIADLQSINALKEAALIELKDQQITSKKAMANIGTDMADIHVFKQFIETLPHESQDTALEMKDENTLDTELCTLSKPELIEKFKATQQEVVALNNEVDLANKNMIKVKSTHKLKLKQMQKTIDNLSKVSDTNAEIVKLNEEVHQLTQKVAELEEEKGNLQLHLVDYDSGRLTESDVYKKLLEMESMAETRLKAISVLEAQKFELVQELHVLQQKNIDMEDRLADMTQLQNEQVCSEIKSVQLEEQIDELTASHKELDLIIENLKLDKEHLNKTIKHLQEEKDEISHKLEGYIQENIELNDKLEKLSAEKVSSAESIEIVESLTTQEKLELEEYNKGMIEDKPASTAGKEDTHDKNNVENLIQQTVELNTKIELFTQERQEVMDKMNKISSENEILHQNIAQLNNEYKDLQENIDCLANEKHELQVLNVELSRQIDELKQERSEIIKETVEATKPMIVEEVLEVAVEQQDEKGTGEKSVSRTKSVKQLTKEILKLKNTIKEREAEIGDCQMKILSLEEQHQKQNELIQTNASYEIKVKSLLDENQILKEKIESLVSSKESEEQLNQLQQTNILLQEELQRTRSEYSNAVSARDNRINELENVLLEYEKQIMNYGNSLQQKDKEMVEYMNQITKLNDVSQKLKSTIEILEEEKAKDQSAELVKTLNKQISAYQKKLSEYEEKLKQLEDEKVQLLAFKSALENKNMSIDTEMKKLQESLMEKQNLIKELQSQKQEHSEEVSSVMLQAKEREEEIHEIKLQLRKESIENEKLRNILSEREKSIEEMSQMITATEEKLNKDSSEKSQLSEQFVAMEVKNKELMDKLKKFATTIKKKSSMYTELENQFHESQKELEIKNSLLEQLSIQVETLPALQEKIKHAEEEVNRLQSQKISLDQNRSQEIIQLKQNINDLGDKLTLASEEITKLNESINIAHKDLYFAQDENNQLKNQVDVLNNKLVEQEIELRNNTNLGTKILSLEQDINQKQTQIADLFHKIENQDQLLSQLQFGHDAKVQERDLYIESLEIEISKYKSRICRLEESISVMEDRRHSLERKADQLGYQLQEKQKAYSDYSSQEDELVNRLAVLIDHDRVVEKQIHEIEDENRQLQDKIQNVTEDNQRLRKTVSDLQETYNVLLEKAGKSDAAETELVKYQTNLREIELQYKKVTQEHQSMLLKKKQDIEELESEFNIQIENAIKEKKILSEKYEKVIEHVSQLENKLLEYRNENERLRLNMEELNKLNQEISETARIKEKSNVPDYTEQYINEINRLNSIVNNKDQEYYELNNQFQSLQVNEATAVSNHESKIQELTLKLQQSTDDVDQLMKEINILKETNDQQQILILQKEEQIKELKEKKKVSFEMNIPKTEGLIISSTIEALNIEEPHKSNLLDLESQIISDTTLNSPEVHERARKTSESTQKKTSFDITDAKNVVEETIVPKKAYLCYKPEEEAENRNVDEEDPFNSDEGWGLGESDETDVVPGFSHFNAQICLLQKENESLKNELDVNNTKLIKVMKKFKELKANNEMLSNELKLSKHLSQSSFLDSAIEDELRSKIQELEKLIFETQADLVKEKREKESIKKQNEVFNNANERLMEMKEKLDNEVELWKYKFKEINDKMSTLQWTPENTETFEPKQTPSYSNVKDDLVNEDIVKLEKENDELQSIVDQITSQNNELLTQKTNLRNEIENLNVQLQQSINCTNCKKLNNIVEELTTKITSLTKDNEILTEKLNTLQIRSDDAFNNYESLRTTHKEIQKTHEISQNELSEKFINLQNELKTSVLSEKESRDDLMSVKGELELVKGKLLELQQSESQSNDMLILSEKYFEIEQNSLKLKQHLDESSVKIIQLESSNKQLQHNLIDSEHKMHLLNSKIQELINENQQLLSSVENLSSTPANEKQENDNELGKKVKLYEEQIGELNSKIQNLNTENDQLLSTVAELRSSVSSAVDQRGFEIAELWKQHLAQREADFIKVEQELRAELSASEVKYEQLLDNVQSSSQEETNILITMEQVSSLQNKVQDKEEHLRNLQDKYGEVINQLDMLRSEMEDEKVIYENKFLTQQEEYEKVIQDLTSKNHQHTENFEQNYKSIQNELVATKVSNDELKQQADDLTTKIEQLEATVVELNNQLRFKESEVYQKAQEYTITLAQRNEEFENVRKQLLEYEKRLEDLCFEKESELAILRLKMHDIEEHFTRIQSELEIEKSTITEALNVKIIECTNLNKQISELHKTLEEHESQSKEMQAALENQEYEIVSLKDELQSFQQMLRKGNSKIEKHVTFASNTKSSDEGESSEGLINKDLLDAVPRAELDLALYMLHQRDVRCEELTMELTQLLEERDTLQLRLSDSLRSTEELKSRLKSGDLDISTDSQETISELPSFSIEKEHQFVDIHRGQTSRSSSISDVDSDKPKLQAKLSELRSVRHSRDVRFRQQSEQRQMDLRLLQRDVAHLPPEAVDQLAHAHHTLSRDSQSTSTVLLNWLRGKSTPKVVHM